MKKNKLLISILILTVIFLLSACGNNVKFDEGISRNDYKETKEESNSFLNNIVSEENDDSADSIEYAKYKLLDFAIYSYKSDSVQFYYSNLYVSYLDDTYNAILTTNIKNFENAKKHIRLHYLEVGDGYVEQQVDASLDIYLTPEMTKKMFR